MDQDRVDEERVAKLKALLDAIRELRADARPIGRAALEPALAASLCHARVDAAKALAQIEERWK